MLPLYLPVKGGTFTQNILASIIEDPHAEQNNVYEVTLLNDKLVQHALLFMIMAYRCRTDS